MDSGARSPDATEFAESLDAASVEKVCAAFETEAQFVEFNLWLPRQDKSLHLRFPAKYVDDPRSYRADEPRTTSFIRVDIDTFEPISRYQDHLRFKAGIYDKMGVLIGDGPPLEQHALILAASSAGDPFDREPYPERAGPFGLNQLVYETRRKEVFVARTETDELADVFACSTQAMVPFPGCSQFFKFKGIDVKASYRRTFLPEWRSIRTRIEAFLTCASSFKNEDRTMALTTQQMEELRDHMEAGDRIAYYSALASFGDPYGTLALAVVNNDTTRGAGANFFFSIVANQESVNISNQELAEISLRLMQEDFDARQQFGDLTVDRIQEYHEAVYADYGVSANAWTPESPSGNFMMDCRAFGS